MADEPIEEVSAELMQGEVIFRQEELCTQLGIGQDLLEVCLRWEIIHRSDTSPDGHALYSGESVDRLCRGLRLHRDLGLNWAGVSVALDLLDRLEELERQVHDRS